VRKLLVLVALCLALFAAPAMATVNLGLPPATPVNFDGNGVFDQTVPGAFDNLGPLPVSTGTELFGTGTISDVVIVPNFGTPVWKPSDSGVEMTFVFWDAFVTSSSRTWTGTPGASNAILSADYADGARMLLVTDTTPDFSSTGGPGRFDLANGDYPTAYTLGGGGYHQSNLPTPSTPFTLSPDAGEEVFLDLSLSGNSSTLTWNPTRGFLSGAFTSTQVEIMGGTGASQFADMFGSADAFLFRFSPTGWAFGGDVDVQLTTVPEPATLIFLGTGLASLIGYRLRRKMA